MTGVSIEQWRGNIGIFDRRNVSKKLIQERNMSSTFLITDLLCGKLEMLRVPIKICCGLIFLFLYCATIVTLLPILMMISIFLDFLLNSAEGPQSLQLWNPLSTPFKIFLVIHKSPKTIAFSFACIIMMCKKFLTL